MTGRSYTHPDVFTLGVAEGWAEAETDPTRIDWPARQAAAAIPFEVTGGRPVNPCEKTAIRYGRNEMGRWGETLMADALVTVTLPRSGARYLLMVERDDGYGWAVPGGHVGPGEPAMFAAVRELAEETGLALFGDEPFLTPETFRVLAPRYVPDPRASDEAWAVTVPVHISLGTRATLPAVTGGDDARRAGWVPAGSYGCLTDALAGKVFAAHAGMLRQFLTRDTVPVQFAYAGRDRSGTARGGVTSESPEALTARCFTARWRELTVYRLCDHQSPVAAIDQNPDTGKRRWWAERCGGGA